MSEAATAYRPFPDRPPLCFIHLRKTGGSSIIEWLKSQFPAAAAAPFRNISEFATLRGRETPYLLYAGHILGGQLDLLPAQTTLFTILRDPAQILASAYYHRRAADLPDPVGRDGDGIGDRHQSLREASLALCRRHTLHDLLNLDAPAVNFEFRDLMTRHLGATVEEHFAEADFSGEERMAARQAQWRRAAATLQRCLIVGDHADLAAALLLLAAERGWPAPPPLPRVHDYRAPTGARAAEPATREAAARLAPNDRRLIEFASPMTGSLCARLVARCGAATAAAVDDHHRARFFAETPRLFAFAADADAGWSGAGWGLRERGAAGDAFRRMTGATATTLVRLQPQAGDYAFHLRVLDSGAADLLPGVGISAAGRRLDRLDQAADAEARTMRWHLPAELVGRAGGDLEIAIAAPPSGSNPPAFAGLGCAPLVAS